MGVVVPFDEARDPADGIKPLLEIVAEDMEAVNRIILDKAVSDVELRSTATSYTTTTLQMFADRGHSPTDLYFVIGADGQKLMEQFRYGVAWKDYPFKREYPERGMTSAEYGKAEDKWLQLTRAITKR